jgi:hypothetical protein
MWIFMFIYMYDGIAFRIISRFIFVSKVIGLWQSGGEAAKKVAGQLLEAEEYQVPLNPQP